MGAVSDFHGEIKKMFDTRIFSTIEVQIKLYLAYYVAKNRMRDLHDAGCVTLVQSGEPKKFDLWRVAK